MTPRAEPVSVADFNATVDLVTSVLGGAVDRDWSLRAGVLRWSCHRTAGHLGDTYLAYACQVITDYQDGWVPFGARVPGWVKPAGALVFVEASAALFAQVVPTVDPAKLLFHPFGAADVEGFLAMGCAETLIHGHDIAQGLALELNPNRDLCGRVVARLFPEQPVHDGDPWALLLAATNRVPHKRGRRAWRYHSSPLS